MLRSAFTQDAVRSWFYIEAFMNPALAKLLFSAPNIVCPNDGLFSIDMEE